MPKIVQCPSCSSKLKVPDDTKKSRCPKCSHVFEIGSASNSTSKRRVKAKPVQAASSPLGDTQAGPAAGMPSGASKLQTAKKIVRCPDCQSTLKISASALGKKVRCPKCSNTFSAGAAAKEHSVRDQPFEDHADASVQTPPQTFEPFGGDDLFGSAPSSSVSQTPELDNFGLAPPSPELFPTAASHGGGYQPYASPPAPRKKKTRRSSSGWQSWLTEPQQLLMLIGIVAAASFVLSAIPILGIVVFIAVLVSYFVIQTAGGIWLVVIAFQEEVMQGILYLFVPFYALFYLITRWDTCRAPFMMCMVSIVSVVSSFFGMIVGTAFFSLILGP